MRCRFQLFSAIVAAAAIVSAGCERSGVLGKPMPAVPSAGESGAAAGAGGSGGSLHLAQAQTGLPTASLLVGPTQLKAEVCRSIPEVATGLMHRKSIGPEETMFFVFGTPQRRSFYMKNVPFPIAAAYIDPEGVIRQIVQLKAMDETPVPSDSDNIQYVLETAPDWFDRHGLGVGVVVATEKGPLQATLARTAQVR
jgi:uncharacterized protein